MTLQEARQQLNECENQITYTYSYLCDAARSMGLSVSKAASSNTTASTLVPLIISLIGLILCFTLSPVGGVILIITGIIITCITSLSATSVQKSVDQQVEYLIKILQSNSRI